MPAVTERMKVSSKGFGTMMFYSSAVPTHAQPFSTSQLFPPWQRHLQDTSSLYTNSSFSSVPDTSHLWAEDKSQPWIWQAATFSPVSPRDLPCTSPKHTEQWAYMRFTQGNAGSTFCLWQKNKQTTKKPWAVVGTDLYWTKQGSIQNKSWSVEEMRSHNKIKWDQS